MQSLKSISLTAVKGQLQRPAVVVRSIRMDAKLLGLKKGFPDTKVSATVRNSKLSDDAQTELKPEEPRKPADLPPPIVSRRRNELEQRKIRKAEYQEYLKKLLEQQKTPPEAVVQCMPFVPNASGSDNPKRRRYDSPEALLEQVSDPKELAKELVKMSRELNTERQRGDLIMKHYLDLESSMIATRGSLAAATALHRAVSTSTSSLPSLIKSPCPSPSPSKSNTTTSTPNSSSNGGN